MTTINLQALSYHRGGTLSRPPNMPAGYKRFYLSVKDLEATQGLDVGTNAL